MLLTAASAVFSCSQCFREVLIQIYDHLDAAVCAAVELYYIIHLWQVYYFVLLIYINEGRLKIQIHLSVYCSTVQQCHKLHLPKRPYIWINTSKLVLTKINLLFMSLLRDRLKQCRFLDIDKSMKYCQSHLWKLIFYFSSSQSQYDTMWWNSMKQIGQNEYLHAVQWKTVWNHSFSTLLQIQKWCQLQFQCNTAFKWWQ